METNNRSSAVPKLVGGIVALLVCCACALILGAGVVMYRAYQQVPANVPTLFPPNNDSVTAMPTVELRVVTTKKNVVRAGVLSCCTVVAAVWSMLSSESLLTMSSASQPKIHKHPAVASRPSVR